MGPVSPRRGLLRSRGSLGAIEHWPACSDPHAFDVRAKPSSALRNLGFREGDVRAVLARLGDEGELAAATTEQWVRAALEGRGPFRAGTRDKRFTRATLPTKSLVGCAKAVAKLRPRALLFHGIVASLVP